MMLTDFLPLGLSVENAITAMAAVAGFVVACMVWKALLANDPMAARARRLGRRREELRSDRQAALRGASRRLRTTTMMRAIAHRLDLLRHRTTAKATEQLACAGWRSPDAIITFMIVKLCAPFLFGAGALVMIRVLQILPLEEPLRSFAPMLAVGLVFVAVILLGDLYNLRARKRHNARGH